MGEFRAIGAVLRPEIDGATQMWVEHRAHAILMDALEVAIRGRDAGRVAIGEMASALLDEVGAGPAGQAHFADMQYDAAWWADLACPRELEVYVGAGLRAIERRRFAASARKRLFVAFWEAMDVEDRRKFLARVDPDGQFVRRAG